MKIKDIIEPLSLKIITGEEQLNREINDAMSVICLVLSWEAPELCLDYCSKPHKYYSRRNLGRCGLYYCIRRFFY